MQYDPKGLFWPQVCPEMTTKELFDSLDYDDWCEDAEILDVLRYARRSIFLEIPTEWRSSLPSWLN